MARGMARYSDGDLRVITGAPDGVYLMTTQANLARKLLAARRALRKADDEQTALALALARCARGWGWWNKERPPIVADLPKHAAVERVIAQVEYEERLKYRALGTRAPRKDARRKKQ
jgi:hypothetical protein